MRPRQTRAPRLLLMIAYRGRLIRARSVRVFVVAKDDCWQAKRLRFDRGLLAKIGDALIVSAVETMVTGARDVPAHSVRRILILGWESARAASARARLGEKPNYSAWLGNSPIRASTAVSRSASSQVS